MIKTVIENRQNLIVEGCYIPFDWQKDFTQDYLQNIRYRCLILSKGYIEHHFGDIVGYGSVIEKRLDDSGLDPEELIRNNEENLAMCQQYGCPYVLIDDRYDLDDILESYEKTGAEKGDDRIPFCGSFSGADRSTGRPSAEGNGQKP